MVPALIQFIFFDQLCYLISIYLPVLFRKGKDLVPAKLNSTGFVDTDMPAVRSDHSLIGTEYGTYHYRICLGASRKKEDIGFRCIAGSPDLFPGRFRVFIIAVSGGLFEISIIKSLHYCRMCAFGII